MNATTATSATGVDLAALLARIHGNQGAMRQLVGLMLSHLPERMRALDDALRDADTPALCAAAHSLRGSLSNFTVGRAWALSGELEALTRSGEWADASGLVADLHSAVAAVDSELTQWLAQDEA